MQPCVGGTRLVVLKFDTSFTLSLLLFSPSPLFLSSVTSVPSTLPFSAIPTIYLSLPLLSLLPQVSVM